MLIWFVVQKFGDMGLGDDAMGNDFEESDDEGNDRTVFI